MTKPISQQVDEVMAILMGSKPRMQLAYVFGPYRAKCEYEVKRNIDAAESVALQLWRMGYSVICPHKNTAFFGGAMGLSDQVWLDGDLEQIRRCDLLVGVNGWEQSEGSKAEVAFAKKHGIPVFASLKELIDSKIKKA